MRESDHHCHLRQRPCFWLSSLLSSVQEISIKTRWSHCQNLQAPSDQVLCLSQTIHTVSLCAKHQKNYQLHNLCFYHSRCGDLHYNHLAIISDHFLCQKGYIVIRLHLSFVSLSFSSYPLSTYLLFRNLSLPCCVWDTPVVFFFPSDLHQQQWLWQWTISIMPIIWVAWVMIICASRISRTHLLLHLQLQQLRKCIRLLLGLALTLLPPLSTHGRQAFLCPTLEACQCRLLLLEQVIDNLCLLREAYSFTCIEAYMKVTKIWWALLVTTVLPTKYLLLQQLLEHLPASHRPRLLLTIRSNIQQTGVHMPTATTGASRISEYISCYKEDEYLLTLWFTELVLKETTSQILLTRVEVSWLWARIWVVHGVSMVARPQDHQWNHMVFLQHIRLTLPSLRKAHIQPITQTPQGQNHQRQITPRMMRFLPVRCRDHQR